jgi:hypothetical protein
LSRNESINRHGGDGKIFEPKSSITHLAPPAGGTAAGVPAGALAVTALGTGPAAVAADRAAPALTPCRSGEPSREGGPPGTVPGGPPSVAVG